MKEKSYSLYIIGGVIFVVFILMLIFGGQDKEPIVCDEPREYNPIARPNYIEYCKLPHIKCYKDGYFIYTEDTRCS